MKYRTWVRPAVALLVAGLCISPALAVNNLTLVPEKTCFTTTGENIVISVVATDLSEPIVGAQLFLEYTDPGSCWVVDTIVPVAPFVQMYQDKATAGKLDYAVHISPFDPAVGTDSVIAIITMKWAPGATSAACCAPTMQFRSHEPPTALTNASGAAIAPTLGAPVQVFIDSQAPVITACALDQTVSATPGACQATVDVGAPEATDNCAICSVVPVRSDGLAISDPYPVGVTTIVWTVTDCCGNATECVQTITVLDTEEPVITCPGPIVLDADAKCTSKIPDLVALSSATDNCDPLPDIIQLQLPGETLPLGDTDVAVCAIDDAGNRSCCEVTITVRDVTPPAFIVCPADINVVADAGECAAVVEWTVAALDNCDKATDVVCDHESGTSFGAGSTVVTCTTADEAGNSSTCSFTVNVSGENSMNVEVELQPAMKPGPFTRQITFDLFNCELPATATVSATLTFVNGKAVGVVPIPCGVWDCVLARDTLHTLKKAGTLTLDGLVYKATFTGKQALIGGNFNDDLWVDILDFGLFFGQFNKCYGPGCPGVASGSTDAATLAPHCDVNGDGRVTALDFTFVHLNFLKKADVLCCASPDAPADAPAGPVKSISVAELKARGMADVAQADLNGDGVLDAKDVASFFKKNK